MPEPASLIVFQYNPQTLQQNRSTGGRGAGRRTRRGRAALPATRATLSLLVESFSLDIEP